MLYCCSLRINIEIALGFKPWAYTLGTFGIAQKKKRLLWVRSILFRVHNTSRTIPPMEAVGAGRAPPKTTLRAPALRLGNHKNVSLQPNGVRLQRFTLKHVPDAAK